MEDLVGIIIYILIAIVGILASIYRNKSRHKSIIPPPVESTRVDMEPEESIEREFDPFAALFEERREERTEERIEERIEVKEDLTSEKDSQEEYLYQKSYTEGEAVFEETREIMISDSMTDTITDTITDSISGESLHEIVPEISDSILDKELSGREEEKSLPAKYDESLDKKEYFDLKTAIIYSEILKRKG